ncbi:MAG: biosynthetic-type acetolactate synthase large subunit [Desulfohalobiaceae bacterium]|nr:biosynthetic-type acetolactate synthase large subunit [Desulfohalobiaceae bacterium]
MKLTGAQILLESMVKEGVDKIFGYPGGAVLDIYHALSDYPLQHFLVRHEQGAVHAADGFARASGRTGVALVTSGPGATNAITGIATAYMDSIPLVIFTGQVPTKLIGNDAFQEVDIVGISRSCTKHNYLVKDVKDLARTIKEAFYLARSGRPGPVLVDLPKDVVAARTEYYYPKQVSMRSYNPTYKANKRQIQKGVTLIKKAKRPLIFTGGGVIASDAHAELTRLARQLEIPVTSSMMGLGSFPGNDPLHLGMLGMHGTYVANMAVNYTDLLIAVGVRFDDRVTGKLETFAPEAKIIHIDIDPTSIRKNVSVDVPIVSDCKRALEAINEEFAPILSQEDLPRKFASWRDKIRAWEESHPLSYEDNGEVIKPQMVVEKLYEITKGEAIIATEVGQNQMWATQHFKYHKPRTLLTSGGLGTMGYGFPAAIGAQVAFPDKLVIDIAGDGSIQMNIQELTTAVCHRLPVKIIILNNCCLGMVRQWQELFYDRNYSFTCLEQMPDFVKLAEAFGAEGYRIQAKEEIDPVLRQALSSPYTAVVDVLVEQGENVYPMVPSGAGLNEMLLV